MVEIQTLVDFFQSYGYIAVFGILILCGLGLPVPEDISLIAGGIISGLGFTNVHGMLAVALAGVLIGDSTMFLLGRKFGDHFFDKKISGRIITHKRYEAITSWFAKYGKGVLLAARFMPGLRSPIFVSAGLTRFVSYTTFIIIDGSASLISVPFWIFLGYYGATNREWLIRWITRSQYGILGLIFLIILIFIVYAFIRRKLRNLNGRPESGSADGETNT